jgi:hypothetical protein
MIGGTLVALVGCTWVSSSIVPALVHSRWLTCLVDPPSLHGPVMWYRTAHLGVVQGKHVFAASEQKVG